MQTVSGSEDAVMWQMNIWYKEICYRIWQHASQAEQIA
jgi:hypothetical protein